jgi:hypothetical protein
VRKPFCARERFDEEIKVCCLAEVDGEEKLRGVNTQLCGLERGSEALSNPLAAPYPNLQRARCAIQCPKNKPYDNLPRQAVPKTAARDCFSGVKRPSVAPHSGCWGVSFAAPTRLH